MLKAYIQFNKCPIKFQVNAYKTKTDIIIVAKETS